jgi:hypothetical protein
MFVRRVHAAAAILLLAAALGACTANSSGIPCEGTSNCPTGYACVSGTCVQTVVDSRRPDASMVKREASIMADQGVRPADAGQPEAPIVTCPGPSPGVLFVAANATPPSVDGSFACPYHTITDALGAAGTATSTTITVEPGLYDANLGETFPLEITPNIKLTGDTTLGRGRDAFVVDGAGTGTSGQTSFTATVHLAGEIDYMTLGDTTGVAHEIVFVDYGSDTLSLVTVLGGLNNAINVSASDATTLTIENQGDIKSVMGNGLWIGSASGVSQPTVNVTDTAIHDCGNDGVFVDSGNVTLGPGVPCSAGVACVGGCPSAVPLCPSCGTPQGAVAIYCNKNLGVEVNTASPVANAPVIAEHDFWNNSVTSCGGGGGADYNDCSVDVGCSRGKAVGACGN